MIPATVMYNVGSCKEKCKYVHIKNSAVINQNFALN